MIDSERRVMPNRRVFDRPSKSFIDLPDDYKLVYQGGHHNVYCNGAQHYTTSGGFTGASNDKMGYGFTRSCDCARWKSSGEGLVAGAEAKGKR